MFTALTPGTIAPAATKSAFSVPPEILHHLLMYLEKGDLENARLVCSLWSELTIEYLFDRIFFSNRSKDIEVFQAWTANSKCAAAVKELVYDVAILNPELSLHDYTVELWDHLACDYLDSTVYELKFEGSDRQIQEICHHMWTGKLLGPGKSFSWPPQRPSEYDEGEEWRNYDVQTCFRETPASCFLEYPVILEGYQNHIRQAQLMMQSMMATQISGNSTLKVGLEKLPKLTLIRLWEEESIHWDRYDWPVSLLPMSKTGPPSVREWHPMHLPPTYRKPSSAEVPLPYFRASKSDPDLYFAQHDHLFRALSEVSHNFSKLEFGVVQWHVFARYVFPGLIGNQVPLPKHIHAGFAGLRSLKVGQLGRRAQLFGNEDCNNGLTACLAACRGLEELEMIEFCFPKFPDHFRGQPSLLNLRRLKIVDSIIGSGNLASFLSQRELQRLELCRVELQEPPTEPFFQRLNRAISRVSQVCVVSTYRSPEVTHRYLVTLDILSFATLPKVKSHKDGKPKSIDIGDWSSQVMNRQPWHSDLTRVSPS